MSKDIPTVEEDDIMCAADTIQHFMIGARSLLGPYSVPIGNGLRIGVDIVDQVMVHDYSDGTGKPKSKPFDVNDIEMATMMVDNADTILDKLAIEILDVKNQLRGSTHEKAMIIWGGNRL